MSNHVRDAMFREMLAEMLLRGGEMHGDEILSSITPNIPGGSATFIAMRGFGYIGYRSPRTTPTTVWFVTPAGLEFLKGGPNE